MLYTTFLPSIDKEVKMKLFCMGDIYEYINLNTKESKIKYLNQHILTKNLNCVEKFLALIDLRSKCISPTFTVADDKRNINVSLGVFDGVNCDPIKESVEVDNFVITMDYPVGLDNDKYSVISKISIMGKEYNLHEISSRDRSKLLEVLPLSVTDVVNSFIERKKNFLNITLLEGSTLPSINIDFVGREFGEILTRLFDVLELPNYRELIFVLCERVPDVSFLQQSTYSDIQDYMDLYKREVDRKNDELKKQSSKYK